MITWVFVNIMVKPVRHFLGFVRKKVYLLQTPLLKHHFLWAGRWL